MDVRFGQTSPIVAMLKPSAWNSNREQKMHTNKIKEYACWPYMAVITSITLAGHDCGTSCFLV